MTNEFNIDLLSSFIEVEGQVKINGVCFNYDSEGGVQFSGYRKVGRDYERAEIAMNKLQVEAINECIGIREIYECYKDIKPFLRGGIFG